MKQLWPLGAKVFGGLVAAALCALPQAYTISAKPGAINFVEGTVLLDGQPLSLTSLKSAFLNAGSLLETQNGRAELLLTPGVFLRVGEHSHVRMLQASLVDTQIAIESGESMLEVDQYIRESHVSVSISGAVVDLQKQGLYRFRADEGASVAVIDGKAGVAFGEKRQSLGKGREALLTDALKTRKFDKDQPDELYVWSNIRSQYNASLTYQASRTAYASGYGAGGAGGYFGPGWYWNNGFNSWLWMPGAGAFYSPFGWGFYGPGYAAYAPVVIAPWGGNGMHPGRHPHPGPGTGGVAVPVNPRRPPVAGTYAASPGQFDAARRAAERASDAARWNGANAGGVGQPHAWGGNGNAGVPDGGRSNGGAGAAGAGGGHWTNGGGGAPAGAGGGAARSSSGPHANSK